MQSINCMLGIDQTGLVLLAPPAGELRCRVALPRAFDVADDAVDVGDYPTDGLRLGLQLVGQLGNGLFSMRRGAVFSGDPPIGIHH